MEKGDLRRNPRSQVAAPVQLSWTDRNGNERLVSARVVDISENGMRVESPEPMVPGAYVNFRAERLKLQGSASVRSCKKHGTKYLAGLEFGGGLKWRPKQEA